MPTIIYNIDFDLFRATPEEGASARHPHEAEIVRALLKFLVAENILMDFTEDDIKAFLSVNAAYRPIDLSASSMSSSDSIVQDALDRYPEKERDKSDIDPLTIFDKAKIKPDCVVRLFGPSVFDLPGVLTPARDRDSVMMTPPRGGAAAEGGSVERLTRASSVSSLTRDGSGRLVVSVLQHLNEIKLPVYLVPLSLDEKWNDVTHVQDFCSIVKTVHIPHEFLREELMPSGLKPLKGVFYPEKEKDSDSRKEDDSSPTGRLDRAREYGVGHGINTNPLSLFLRTKTCGELEGYRRAREFLHENNQHLYGNYTSFLGLFFGYRCFSNPIKLSAAEKIEKVLTAKTYKGIKAVHFSEDEYQAITSAWGGGTLKHICEEFIDQLIRDEESSSYVFKEMPFNKSPSFVLKP